MNADTPARRHIILLVAAGIGLLLLVVFGQFDTAARWGSDLADAAHGPAFAILTLLLVSTAQGLGLRRGYALPAAALIAVLLGAAVEVVQWLLGRDASAIDLLHDALGATVAVGLLLWFAPPSGRAPRWLAWMGMVTAIVAIATLIRPPIRMASAYLERTHGFPTIVDFDHWASLYFVDPYGNVSLERARIPNSGTHKESGLHARLSSNRAWTIAIWEVQPDWRRYTSMEIDIANPTPQPLAITARIRPLGGNADADLRLPIRVAAHARKTVRLALPRRSGGEDFPWGNVATVFLSRANGNDAMEFYVRQIRLR